MLTKKINGIHTGQFHYLSDKNEDFKITRIKDALTKIHEKICYRQQKRSINTILTITETEV